MEATVAVVAVLEGNVITASGASRWSSSIHRQAEWPATADPPPVPKTTMRVEGVGAPIPSPGVKKMLRPDGERPDWNSELFAVTPAVMCPAQS